jgi:hypothetical protein
MMTRARRKRRPTIVCLCGSTRFWREFQRASLRETLEGKIVLSIGAATGTDDDHFSALSRERDVRCVGSPSDWTDDDDFRTLSREEYDQVKARLDELHLRKIDLADEVLILNVGGYIGESTLRELEYARATGKHIRYLERPQRCADGR